MRRHRIYTILQGGIREDVFLRTCVQETFALARIRLLKRYNALVSPLRHMFGALMSRTVCNALPVVVIADSHVAETPRGVRRACRQVGKILRARNELARAIFVRFRVRITLHVHLPILTLRFSSGSSCRLGGCRGCCG